MASICRVSIVVSMVSAVIDRLMKRSPMAKSLAVANRRLF